MTRYLHYEDFVQHGKFRMICALPINQFATINEFQRICLCKVNDCLA
jgi:hypothetical protein